MVEVVVTSEVLAATAWRSNAEMIVACAQLGYLRRDWRTLDPTWGEGVFWKEWRPDTLIRTDLDPAKSPDLEHGQDFTAMPWQTRSFDAVVFDGPYKLNGTPEPSLDERYGVHIPTRWQDRMSLLEAGTIECARVSGNMLLVKSMDQVCSGRIRWQTRILVDVAEAQGFRLVDQLHVLGGRAQPAGRRQVHARRNFSTLSILERER